MSATIIDGTAVAAAVRDDVRRDVEAMVAAGMRAPSLHVVLCNDDPASATYVRSKERVSAALGMRGEVHTPPLTSSTEDILALVRRLDADDDVDAILVQLPLAPQIDEAVIVNAIAPEKDADGLHPVSMGLLASGRPRIAPCTPAGCMELLRRYDVPVRGSRAVVIGRSVLVGRPMALLLVNADATVTVCHSRTVDLPAVCREADILVAAIGRPGFVDASFVKPGACVIDVGINRVDGAITGDVDRASVEPVAGWLTPVPKGVGPMTVAMLMRNTVELARARRGAGFVPTLS
ncbi:MAG TPA: bifunctional 5,10-methylenetetrahydrofolate dehydrogenase/5,10-methenyltetrahydrofolate cyclohydrolase [Candidatus Dormibacteraeota bacterium]|jgi:methylenetetrahydrofolate dehydrogenase (NADP+)/methenyltetrahydrofolate cyclohydrolase|nr:bifunctional 5,10-methylenetetrahydrofolate dehydrogenase/5,10-methenyltetrahydrofolate cyclohydrolase [Candidatus Dormibacteraeota bacterium]